MQQAIEQRVSFPNVTPGELFDIFTDSVKHGEVIGADVSISAKAGAAFSCFNGNVTGKNLLVIPGRMIVQSWRGNVWTKDDPDSILTLVFSATKNGAYIHMVHSHTPGQFIEKWNEFYWKPMKQLLKKKS